MCIIGTSCRRGTSTVFGVMIFIGIMFTAVIPMLLLMNQANTLYEIRKVEVGRLDEERAIENMYFYLETSIDPETEEPIITLMFYNRCEIAIRIIRVWINGEPREVDFWISPTSDGSLELRNLIDPPYQDSVSFSVRVITDGGNIFLPPSVTPEYSYDPELGGSWEHDIYTIYIFMTEKRPQLHVLVNYTSESPDVTVFDDDLQNNLNGYWIGVPFAGDYLIIVTQFYDIILFEGSRTVGPGNFAVLIII